MTERIVSLELRTERDVVIARQRAREIASLLGFDKNEQTQFATAVSEVARNAFRYAVGGVVEYMHPTERSLAVRVSDRGPGIADLANVLAGRVASRTGMGMGLIGARRLCDDFQIESEVGIGTRVTMVKLFPAHVASAGPQRLREIAEEIARLPHAPVEELAIQNQELFKLIDELRTRNFEVEQLNRELDETNRGVLALYSELDETAQALRSSSAVKSAFLSSVSHELRTPLSSILNLSHILLSDLSGDEHTERRRQVRFIRQSAESLFDIVNDLLDLAKIEAGKAEAQLGDFPVGDMLATLRGVCRPLVASDAVVLVIEEPAPELTLHSDEGKLSQILRNLIANAIKFTERGEVRVSTRCLTNERIVFTVADTGIGIAAEHLETIFSEYAQIEGPLQRRNKGTGLGLPLSRKLTTLLGGELTVTSELGTGSIFSVTLPMRDSTHDARTAEDRQLAASRGRTIAPRVSTLS